MTRGLIALGIGAVSAVAVSAAVTWRRRQQPQLEDLTKDELYERARAADIPGRSEMNKDELIRALRSAA